MNSSLMIGLFDVGGQEMLLILVAILILFGAKKLPEMARNIGRSVEQFKRAANSVRNEVINADLDETTKPSLPESTSTDVAATTPHEGHEAGIDGYTPPAEVTEMAAESKTEVTLNAPPAQPPGTVSQSEPHDQQPA